MATVLSSTGVERRNRQKEESPTQGEPENVSALGFAEILVAGLRFKLGKELGFWEEGQS